MLWMGNAIISRQMIVVVVFLPLMPATIIAIVKNISTPRQITTLGIVVLAYA